MESRFGWPLRSLPPFNRNLRIRFTRPYQGLLRSGGAQALDDPVAEGAGVVFDGRFVKG